MEVSISRRACLGRGRFGADYAELEFAKLVRIGRGSVLNQSNLEGDHVVTSDCAVVYVRAGEYARNDLDKTRSG